MQSSYTTDTVLHSTYCEDRKRIPRKCVTLMSKYPMVVYIIYSFFSGIK